MDGEKNTEEIPDRVRNAKRESKYLDFKSQFDVNRRGDWSEIIKDIVAMANSGGGIILLGVSNDGSPSGWDPTPLSNYDAAPITDKIASYVGEQFADFEFNDLEKEGHPILALVIRGVRMPMIFVQEGSYEAEDGKLKKAFAKGTIYFRHGPKSEPANSKDLRGCLEREMERARASWQRNIRKVIKAPVGYEVVVRSREAVGYKPLSETPIRLVNDLSVPTYGKLLPDHTHPYRQKEVLKQVKVALGNQVTVTEYDILSVRRVNEINGTKLKFCHEPMFGSPQYSLAFVEWLVKRYHEDHSFFDNANEEYKQQKRKQRTSTDSSK